MVESTLNSSTDRRNDEATPANESLSPYDDRYVTVPNIICVFRIVGSVCLVPLAVFDYPTAFVVGFIVLSLSDWVDGKLAILLNQRSAFGARLDSASDAVLYICPIIGSLVLKWDVLQTQWGWVAMALASYALTTGYGLWKYGRVPSYHTRGAKISQWIVLGAGVVLVLDWSLWPLRIAAVATTLTNLEATAMTRVLDQWHADLLSYSVAVRKQREQSQSSGESDGE